jgi:hypothetical protein
VTRQEHKNILAFLDQMLNAPQGPLDIEADAIIRAYFKRNPDAAYRLTMMAMNVVRPAEMEVHSEPKRRGLLPLLLRGWQV